MLRRKGVSKRFFAILLSILMLTSFVQPVFAEGEFGEENPINNIISETPESNTENSSESEETQQTPALRSAPTALRSAPARVNVDPSIAIVRVSDGGEWQYFEYLITNDATTGAFDYVNTMEGDVIIEFLKDTDSQYTLIDTFTFDQSGLTSLSFRASDDIIALSEKSTLVRGHYINSMIIFDVADCDISIENIIFDGNDIIMPFSGGGILQRNTTGSLTIENCEFTNNNVEGDGGAIYITGGTGSFTNVTVTNSMANHGAAIFSNGSITMSNCVIAGNTAIVGGAVEAGSTSARYYFAGDTQIYDNVDTNGDAKNFFLNQNSYNVFNIKTLTSGANICVYVDGTTSDDIFLQRGTQGSIFGSYGSSNYRNNIHSDRHPTFRVDVIAADKLLYWTQPLTVGVRYLSDFSGGFPPTTTGTSIYNSNSFTLSGRNYTINELINESYSRYRSALATHSTVASYCFTYIRSTDTFYDRYSRLDWDVTNEEWIITAEDGTTSPLGSGRLIIYYSDAASVLIENNTNMSLALDSLQVLGTDLINYAFVFARNGVTQSTLEYLSASDMIIGAGESIRLVIPGATNQSYTLSGHFTTNTTSGTAVHRTGESLVSLTLSDVTNGFTFSGTTSSSGIYEITFGDYQSVCKIGDANIFSSISDAIQYLEDNSITTATIEMLKDYFVPNSDSVVIPDGYNITIQTAVTGTYQYAGTDPNRRATLKRNVDKTTPIISGSVNVGTTILTVLNLNFDGENSQVNNDGGAIRVTNIKLTINHCSFKNFKFNNSGAVCVEFTTDSTYDFANYSSLVVLNSDFSHCESSTDNRAGGAAIWTNTYNFDMKSCTFTNCRANTAQSGAVFHCINADYLDAYKAGSSIEVTNCEFTNCAAQAAGGLEIDSYHATVDGCTFTNCRATSRNGGGFNYYIQTSDSSISTADTYLIISNTIFDGCSASQDGGSFKSLAKHTTITNCDFDNSSALNGGGVYLGNSTSGADAIMTNSTVDGCTATTSGGGIYTECALIIDGTFIRANEAAEKGGGVYSKKNITLRNGTLISNNTILSSNTYNGAGMFLLGQTPLLTIGTLGATLPDSSSVQNNYAAGNQLSNVKLPENNSGTENKNSVIVLCGLNGHIGVANAKVLGTIFGTNQASSFPVGFSDASPVFVADDESMWGIIDRAHTANIYWADGPIVKITDASDNLLYFDIDSVRYPATFYKLDNGTTSADNAGAFSILKNTSRVLLNSDGTTYTGEYYVKMLIEEYTSPVYISTNQNNASWQKIHLTTETSIFDFNTNPYGYRGTPGTNATIYRGSAINADSLMTAKVDMWLENITLDGNSLNGEIASASGCIFLMKQNKNAVLTLGNNVILQNGATSLNGGAIWISSSNGGSVVMDGAIIRNCSANNGGGIYVDYASSTITIGEGSSIENCTAVNNGGAVNMNKGSLVLDGATISGSSAQKGAAIYVAGATRTDVTDSTITGCTATASNGGAINFNNSGAKIWLEGAVKIYDNLCDGNQSNLVLSHNTNSIINTTGVGISNSSKIGVYVTGTMGDYLTETEPFKSHGNYGEPFGTWASANGDRNLRRFINDRNGLRAMPGMDSLTGYITWSLEIRVEDHPVFHEFENKLNPITCQDSAFSLFFETVENDPQIICTRVVDEGGVETEYPMAFPIGTKIILQLWQGSTCDYYYYVVSASTNVIHLDDFNINKMGQHTNSMPATGYQAVVVIDFSSVESNLWNHGLIDVCVAYTGSVIRHNTAINISNKPNYAINRNSSDMVDTDTSAIVDVDTDILILPAVSDSGRASKWTKRDVALVLECNTGTVLPFDAQLSVSINGGAASVYNILESNKFIIPLGSNVDYNDVAMELISSNFASSGATYSFNAKLMVSNTNASESPLNGEVVATRTITMASASAPTPSIKVESDVRAVPFGQPITFTISEIKCTDYDIEATIYKKGTDWNDLTLVDSNTLKNAGTTSSVDPDNPSTWSYSYTPPSSSVNESYKMVVEIKDGSTVIASVTYYFLAINIF